MATIDENIRRFENSKNEYPDLHRAAVALSRPSAPILGRDMAELERGLRNPEKANVILLGEPGSGKTAYIQGFAFAETSNNYLVLSVDVERLVKDSSGDKDTEMANGLMDLVADTSRYSKENDVITILFIDEFHRIAMVSPSAVEALKPILEKSAHNGFRVVAATTFEEYDQWIAVNRALDQRMLRITLPELPREAVIQVLKSRAKQYGVLEVADPLIFEDIYDTTKSLLLSNSQPRASIDVLLNMVGHITKLERMENGRLIREYATAAELDINNDYALSRPILNRVIQHAYGIDIDNKVSIPKVREALRTRILNQEQALDSIIARLELSLVGFNDPTRPKISFLSTGPTGVGKALLNDEWIWTANKGYVRNGKLEVGDLVLGRSGQVTEVEGVFPQGDKWLYGVELVDGRFIKCSSNHLWTYKKGDEWLTKETWEMAADLEEDTLYLPQTKFENYELNEEAFLEGEKALYLLDDNQDLFLETLRSYRLRHPLDRWSFLQGLVANGSFSFRLTNVDLVSSFTRFVSSLGLFYARDLEVRKKGNPVTVLTLLEEELETGLYPGELVKIKAIKEYGVKAGMTCIKVAADDSLYQAGLSHIVTHNTELAKTISDELGIPLKRFDMSRYSRPEDAVAFGDQLAQAAWSAPNGYILIDEVEKSSKEAMNVLLQVLDDARLTAANNPNRVISFTGNIINLTTNVASDVYQHMKNFSDENARIDEELIYQALNNSAVFNSAVLGRIDLVVPFRPLPDSAMRKIAEKKLLYDVDLVETAERPIFISKDIIPYIVIDRTSRDTERGGARDAKRNITNVVVQKLATYLADEPLPKPLILKLDGVPRFKDKRIADPYAASVEVIECYSKSQVASWLDQLGKKTGRSLIDDGLFIPQTESPSSIVHRFVELIKGGYTRFKTIEVDKGLETIFVIVGNTL